MRASQGAVLEAKNKGRKMDASVRSTPTHRVCVGAVGAEGERDGGVEDAKLPHHLLHASDGALLVCVGELHHQA